MVKTPHTVLAKKPLFSSRLLLNLFIEFGPLLLFFVVFEFLSFLAATLVLVVIVAVTFALSILIEKRIAVFPLFASGSILVFGVATLFFKNPTYIIFKDTLFYGIFCVIITYELWQGRLVLKKLFISIFDITDRGWKIVSMRWAVFMFLLAGSNQLALLFLSTTAWVYYKMGTLAALILFSLWQFVLSKNERLPTANAWGMRI